MKVIAIYMVLACFAAGLPQAAEAKVTKFELNIPRQPLDTALDEFSRVTGLSVARMSDQGPIVGDVGPLRGQFEPHAALDQLLKGTSYKFEFVNDHMIRIFSDDAAASLSGGVDAQRISRSTAERNLGQASELPLVAQSQGGFQQQRQSDATTGSQVSNDTSDQLQEILVTAQKREERLQDVPISVFVVSNDEIGKRNVTSLDDLATVVPGLAVIDQGQSRRIFLRGVANIAGTGSQIGLYLDEADVTSQAAYQIDLDTYDLQRVEVLRGPQGTLYGDGSVGGTIRLITNDPILNKVEMGASVTSMVTEHGDPTERVQEVVNVPLIDDQLGLRVAGMFDHEGGWIDQPAANQQDINQQSIADVRVKLLWQPIQDLSLNGAAEIHRNNETPSAGEDASGNFTQALDETTTPKVRDDYDLYSITTKYDTLIARVVNAATYLSQYNAAFNSGTFLQLVPPPAPPDVETYLPEVLNRNNIYSDELRISSNGDGPWQWTLGSFYRHSVAENYTAPFSLGLNFPPAPLLILPNPASSSEALSKSWSGFGDTSYRVLPLLKLGAGVRYYTDDESISTPFTEAKFHAVSPRGYADLKLTNEVSLYTSAAKGFRSGGFNYRAGEPPYGPESVWTYEFGEKSLLLDKRLGLDVDIFYSNYSNYVATGINPEAKVPLDFYQNVGSVVIKGVEWNAVWKLVNGWSATFNGDYLQSYFTKLDLTPATSPYAIGDPLDLSPRYQGTLSVEREFKLTGRDAFARLDYNYLGPSTYRNRATGPWYFSESDIIQLVNLNAGLKMSEKLSVSTFVQNLLDNRGYTSPIVIEQGAARSRPRSFGVRFDASF